MTKLTYNPYFFYKFSLLIIEKIQTNHTLIFANNKFINKEEKAIKDVKIMRKD